MASEPQSGIFIWLDRHFSLKLPATRFARNVALLSLAGLVPVLALYIALSPGLGAHLGGSGDASRRFARQIITNGLPVVFVVNALGFIFFANMRARRLPPWRALAFDITTRVGVFTALHLIIYPASALMFGSFGSDPAQGLRVVGPTLAQSAGFANLSGVYLYATLVSALPLHMALITQARESRRQRPLSLPVLTFAALAIFAGQALLLTALALLMGGWR